MYSIGANKVTRSGRTPPAVKVLPEAMAA